MSRVIRHNLNETEMKILKLIATGITSNKEIGSEVFLHRGTVTTYIKSIGRKLGVSGKFNILRQALIQKILIINDLKGGEA